LGQRREGIATVYKEEEEKGKEKRKGTKKEGAYFQQRQRILRLRLRRLLLLQRQC